MNGTVLVGLYSISVRGMDVPELLSWACRRGIPFVHLRGGRSGYDLASQDAATLRRWRETSTTTVPITGVTADTDIAALVHSDPALRRKAREDVRRLAETAHSLGASWVRLLARHPLSTAMGFEVGAERLDSADLTTPRVPLLIELHDPHWLAQRPHTALVRFLEQQQQLRLLADSAQLAQALARAACSPDGGRAVERLERLGTWVEVLHLSDHGLGLTEPGHALVADQISRRIAGGQRVEIAMEWTGVDRGPAAALARYREHTTWWAKLHASHQETAS